MLASVITFSDLLDPAALTAIQIIVLSVGFVGEVMFGMRFIIQWIASERRKRSVMPVAFWYLSIGGSLMILVYAIYQRDPIFVAGIAPTIPIYIRNLYFVHKKKQRLQNSEKSE